MSFQISYLEILSPHSDGTGDGAIGRYLDHKGGALVMGLMSL